MSPQPFCCDIESGTSEEQNEFKGLFVKAMGLDINFIGIYYGYSINGKFSFCVFKRTANVNFTRILPLSEGIKILKEVVMESNSPSLSVVKCRIIDAVNKSLKYTDGQISGIDMNQLEERVDGILNSLQPKP